MAIVSIIVLNYSTISANFIVNTTVILKSDYAIRFPTSLTSSFILDIKTDWSLIYQY